MRDAFAFPVLAIALASMACTTLLGDFKEGTSTSDATTPPDAAAGADGADGADGTSVDGAVEDAPENALDAPVLDAPVINADSSAPCDDTEVPAAGIFVSPPPNGSDTLGDGSPLHPLGTIAHGLAAAGASPSRKTVYLDEGTYPEAVVFAAAQSGIVLRGGFKAAATTWVRDCAARGLTLIKSPTNVGVSVAGTTTSAGLKELTVTTKASGASLADSSGESIYGIQVTGDGTLFSLDAVTVIAGNGGSGGTASAGTTPASPAAACGTTCSTGAAGTDGAPVSAASAGTFTAAGYVPGDGALGHDGQAGKNGMPGQIGSSASCVTCPGCPGTNHINCACSQSGCCSCDPGPTNTGPLSTAPGPCGCGGPGGIGGKPGRGGGASVGLFISGKATVSVTYASLQGGNGGAGSPGGASAPGATGSAGTTAQASCFSGPCTCADDSNGGTHCGSGSPTAVTSMTGTRGGSGGQSSLGSGGAGGASFGAVLVNGGSFIGDGTVAIFPGTSGTGAGGAADGLTGGKLSL